MIRVGFGDIILRVVAETYAKVRDLLSEVWKIGANR